VSLGGCAENFGEPESVRRLASAYLETGSGLDDLVAELRRQVRDTVPNEWRGATASDFQQLTDQVLNAATQAADRARRVANAALKMAGRLEAARREYDAAVVIAQGGGYYVSEACLVTPYRPDSQLNHSAGFEADRMVHSALAEAVGARQEFRATTAETRAERTLIWRRFIAQSMAVMAGGGRPMAGRPSRPPRPSLQQLRETIKNSEIVVQQPPPSTGQGGLRIGSAGEPNNARLGREFHQMLARADRPFEGQRLGDSNWEVLGVERTFGDRRRVDYVLINRSTQEIKVFDYYTGAREPLEHNIKGWEYRNTPEIQRLTQQGYSYEYIPVLVNLGRPN
jgi:uncharacterized protein YukE